MARHGPVACDRCWRDCSVREKFVGKNKDYRIVNDPGYWGAPNPRVLVLGMSKGNTQANAMVSSYNSGNFDAVAYSGFRNRLLQVLQAVGLMCGDNNISRHLTAEESDWGFASILRCSLTARTFNPKKQEWEYSAASSGVIRGMKSELQPWLVNCIDEHILRLKNRTRLVILLGNAENYFGAIEPAMRRVFSDYRPHPTYGRLVFIAGGRFFVHVAHPSKLNGHFGDFLNGDYQRGQGEKRERARKAIAGALGSLIAEL